MSALQREMIQKPHRVEALNSPATPISTVPEEEEDGSSSSASSMSSTGTVVPTNGQRTESRPQTSWHAYFDQELFLESTVDGGRKAQFHVYLTNPTNPEKDPVFVCHHGAGSSGLSFALFAQELRRLLPNAGILSVEAREHGSVVERENSEPNLSLDELSSDLMEMISLTQQRLWRTLPKLVLVGHSLGGAVVTKLAKDGNLGSKLVGFVVIDVVEGSAMEALKSMQTYLRSRPSSFSSVKGAINWHTRSRTIRNPASASISTPPLLKESSNGVWIWRTDLSQTQAYWENWFTGMSSSFLGGKAAKLLLLAGTDRLDKDLMIGQMQGKFQLQVFPEAGHFVQEDIPEKTAETVVEFFKRNDRSTLVLPPKVGDLLAQGKKV